MGLYGEDALVTYKWDKLQRDFRWIVSLDYIVIIGCVVDVVGGCTMSMGTLTGPLSQA